MAIRAMTVEDLPEVFAVRVSTIENAITMAELEEWYGLTPETLAEAMQDAVRGWVCEIDRKIVAFVMGDKASGELTVLAVLPEFERRGIGKQLLKKVQDWLFSAGHKELWLLTTPNPDFRAYGFYQSQAWVPSGEIVDEEDEKFVLAR